MSHVNVAKKLVPLERVWDGDLAAQWVEGPDGSPEMVALTLVRDKGSADQAEDLEVVLLLDQEEVDVVIAMLQGARRHVELGLAKKKVRQGN
jgi:hypothetical protein